MAPYDGPMGQEFAAADECIVVTAFAETPAADAAFHRRIESELPFLRRTVRSPSGSSASTVNPMRRRRA
jgi:hypothetical protein